MDRMDMAQRLKDKAQCTYEEAREALEANEWDLLDAITYLERQGKVHSTSTEPKQEEPKMEQQHTQKQQQSAGEKGKSVFSGFVNWLSGLIEKGNQNYLVIRKGQAEPFTIPLTIAVLLALMFNGLTFLVIVISLLLGFRYSFLSQKEVQQIKQDIRDADQAAEQINNHHTVNSFGEGQA